MVTPNNNTAENKNENVLVKVIRLITGARGSEQRQVLCCFSALMCLLVSYYMIKPLRNSQFLKEFHPAYRPLLDLFVPILSLALTKVYNFFSDRVDRYRLIIYVYLIIIACKVVFTWYLPHGGKPAIVIFYYWASIYFLLAMATLWACFNDFFTSEQGERCFGFVAMGATVGNIVGSKVSSWLTESQYKGYATLCSASFMSFALILLIVASRMRTPRATVEKITEGEPVGSAPPPPQPGGFWSDIRGLLSKPYVRGIAIMVACLATFTTSLDTISNKVIDQQLSRKQYQTTFTELNDHLNSSQHLASGDLNEQGYRFIYGLKSESSEAADQALTEFATANGIEPATLKARYANYKDELEGKERKLFSDVFLYQGVVGIVMLVVVARLVFKLLGLKAAAVIMPSFALVMILAFMFPLQLLTVESFLIISGSLNYALNNATKEILYTATSQETKFKHKPLIEGPIMRFGDVGASLLMSFVIFVMVKRWGLPEAMGDKLILGFAFTLTLVWWRAIRRSGRIYETEREGPI